jgi:RNA polymerase sigma factor (sigma-70 family)
MAGFVCRPVFIFATASSFIRHLSQLVTAIGKIRQNMFMACLSPGLAVAKDSASCAPLEYLVGFSKWRLLSDRMNGLTDEELLRDYAENRSEAAFTQLARRHVDLVYSAALRMVHDEALAEDVTQGAFLALVQNVRRLRNRRALPGWLHHTTQHLAANAVRAEVRRRGREQEAVTMNELLTTESNPTWELVAPYLDAALGALSESDRDAVLLRYFENKSLREVGHALGTSDDTAQKRVSRAVEHLREFFARRGVTAGASGLMVVISANAVQAAPVGLTATISTAAALGGTTIIGTATATATRAIAMTTLQKAIVGTVLAVAVGTGIYQARETSSLRTQLQTIEQKQGPLTAQIGQLTSKRDEAARSLAGLREALRMSADNRDLLRLRAEATRLRSTIESARLSTNDPVAAMVESWIAALNRIRATVERSPEAAIPEFRLLDDGDWWKAAKEVAAGMDERTALGRMRYSARSKFTELLKPALQKYVQTHNSQFPTDLAQLRPYFKSPEDDAMLERWKIAPVSEFPELLSRGGNQETTHVVTQRTPSPIEEADGIRWLIQPHLSTATSFKPIPKQ